MPSVTCSGSGSTVDDVAAHARAVAVDDAATNGTGMPGAANDTIVNARTSPSVGHVGLAERRAEARRARVAAVEEPRAAAVHSFATRCGSSPSTR